MFPADRTIRTESNRGDYSIENLHRIGKGKFYENSPLPFTQTSQASKTDRSRFSLVIYVRNHEAAATKLLPFHVWGPAGQFATITEPLRLVKVS